MHRFNSYFGDFLGYGSASLLVFMSVVAINPFGSTRDEIWKLPKSFALSGLLIMMLLYWARTYLQNATHVAQIKSILVTNRVIIGLALAYLSVTFLSAVLSPFPLRSFVGQGVGPGWWTTVFTLSVLNVMLVFKFPRFARWQGIGFTGAALICAGAVLIQAFDWTMDFTISAGRIATDNQLESSIFRGQMPIGLTIHRGHAAIVIALAGAFIAYGRSSGHVGRTAYFSIQLPLLTALWVSGTRAPWLTFVLAIAFLFFAKLRLRLSWVPLLELLILVTLSLGSAWTVSIISGTNIRTTPTLDAGVDRFASGRLALWKDAVKFTGMRPIIGWGSGGFGNAYSANLIRKNARPSTYMFTDAEHPAHEHELDDTYNTGVASDQLSVPTFSAHNVLLDQAVSYGVPAALLFVALWAAILRAIWAGPYRYWAGILIAYWVFLFTWYDAVGYGHLPFLFAGALIGLSQKRLAQVSGLSEYANGEF